ncbi:MAG: hypothetical protein LC803_09690 [Acidobacteria bacterium]|nr:hypothetical protein [Acidobacteriota bacterium]
MPADDAAKIYTFYSYKGGVGRSMAMANVAELLYRSGLRVLMIDFDLEAPGLEQYFYKNDDPELQKVLCKRGVIDLLFSYKSLRSLRDSSPLAATISAPPEDPGPPPEDDEQSPPAKFPYPVEPLSSFVTKVYPAHPNMPGELSIITAGRRAKEERRLESREKQTKDEFALYADRVRSFAWDDFYLNLDGERFFDWFHQEAVKDIDIVLIDSRTGVAEMSGVCTYQLADVVVMFLAPNNQNVDGIKRIADSLTSPDLISQGRKGRKLSLIFVPSRVDLTAEKHKLDDLSARFRQVADKFISPDLNFEINSFVDLRIPYIPYYSFVEEVAVRDAKSPVAIELTKVYKKICRSFAQLDPKVSAKIRPESEPVDDLNLAEQQNRIADQVYEQLTPDKQQVARMLFTRLVRLAQIDAGEVKDSPKNVKLDDLNYQQRGVAQKFSAQGLLVIGEDGTEHKTVGLAAESLIDNWILFTSWINEDREFLIWRQNIQSASLNWEKNGRPDSELLADSRIPEARKWLDLRPDELSGNEAKYLYASFAIGGQKLKLRRLQVAGVILGIIITSFVIYYAYQQNRQLNILEARARQLFSNSQTLVVYQPELSLLLAIEAGRLASASVEARQALKTMLMQTSAQTVIHVGAPVYSARYSHDGKRFVTGSGGGISVAQIWEPGGNNSWQNLTTLRGHLGDVRRAAFSPDDRFIATASYDATAIIWNVAKGEMLGGPTDPRPGSFTDIDWSPKGILVATSAQDNKVYVWDALSQKLFQTLNLFTDNVNCVAFSPDGRFLAAGSRDSQVRVWNTKTWTEATILLKGPLKGHADEVLSVSFSPDSRFLITAGRDFTARIWDTYRWQTVKVLMGHTNAITRASFSPDGKFVVTASDDASAMVWETATGNRVAVLRGLPGSINDASFSPDGKMVLLAGSDGTARLWDLHPQVNPNLSMPELLALACARATRNMTVEEWRLYMGSEPYHATCPDILQPMPTPSASQATQPFAVPAK